MISVHNLNDEEKLLFNGLLLCSLRSQEKNYVKLKSVEKYLTEGADVNTQDANDSNNTPLHIAVKKDEPEIVQFLLTKGANPNAQNKNNHTPTDLAKLSKNKNMKTVIHIIESSINPILTLNEKLDEKELSKKDFQENMSLKFNENYTDGKEAISNKTRSGTNGIRGQLYESKLIALLLHRAKNDDDIDRFYIDSNVAGFGAFDDIIFKYYSKNKNKFSFLIIQAKHKESGKLTMENLLNSSSDFSLAKYFLSYMKIRCTIKQKNYQMFENGVNTSELYFIIFTTAIEEFNKKKLIEIFGKEALLLTSNEGKTFMYDYDDADIKALIKNILMLQAKSLAKVFAEDIIKKRYKNMLLRKLIQIYHIYLGQNVIQVSYVNSEDYLIGNFRESFLNSKDEHLVLIKTTMINIMKMQDKSNEYLLTLKFKLPKYFGNSEVPIKEEKYVDLWQILHCLMDCKEHIYINNIVTIVVNNYENKKVWMNIKYLVGDTLILDDETGLLMLNLNESSSEKNQRLLGKLKSNLRVEIDLKSFRFEINVENFPQLSFRNGSYLKNNLTDFLNKLQLHTNQATEEEIEEILIIEITSFYNTEYKNTNTDFQIKGEAIYLNYHNRVQNWWKSEKKKMLTKSCDFYEKAKSSFLKSPFLNIYNYIHYHNISKMSRYLLHFNQQAVENLALKAFMDCSETVILNIITGDKVLTSIKIKQLFDNNFSRTPNYSFLDLETLSENDNEKILLEIIETMIDVIIFIMKDDDRPSGFEKKFINSTYNNKFIVISNSRLSNIIKTRYKYLELYDENHTICDFDETTRNAIVTQTRVLFQGFETSFVSHIGKNTYDLVKGDVLRNILMKGLISIGKEPISIEAFNESKELFIDRRLCRCLRLTDRTGFAYVITAFIIIHNNDQLSNKQASNDKDIFLVTNDINDFHVITKRHRNKSIHWFQSHDSDLKWVKSYGSVLNIMPYLDRMECDNKCSSEIQTFNHFNEKVVIISAEAGMGKSTFIKHLMVQTKLVNDSNICVIKLNLLDLQDVFSAWHQCNDKLKLVWVLSVLYKSFAICDTAFLNSANIEGFFNKITYVDSHKQVHLNSRLVNNIHELSILELQVFLNLFNDDKITVICDGFDEIYPEYKNEAIEMFQLLLNSRIQNLWITSRPMAVNELECAVKSISFTLKGFSVKEQTCFVEKFWMIYCSSQINLNVIDNKNYVVTQFLDTISHRIMDRKKDFTSNPLHLRMISETFLEQYINYMFYNHTTKLRKVLFDALNLVTLYDKFIDIKFLKIRFGEKKDILNLKDLDIRRWIEKDRILFNENHKIMAAYSLLYKINHKDRQYSAEKHGFLPRPRGDHHAYDGILTTIELEHVHDVIKKIYTGEEKSEIVTKIIIRQNKPIFVHLTYAEYFANEFLCDKLKQSESIVKFFVDHILVFDNYEGIRKFLDAKLEKDQDLLNFTSKCLGEALISEKDSTKSALCIANIEGRENVAYFLLNNLSTILQTNNLDGFISVLISKCSSQKRTSWLQQGLSVLSYQCCILCHAYNRNSTKFLRKVIEIIMQVDCNKLGRLILCDDYPGENMFILTLFHQNTTFHERGNLDIILKYTNPDVLVQFLLTPINIFTRQSSSEDAKRPYLHYLVEDQHNELYIKYLQHLNQDQCMRVFCARDDMKRTAAHWAAFYQNFKFFEVMASILETEQLKIVCTVKDIKGFMPLQNFVIIDFVLDKFMSLCAKAGITITGPFEEDWCFMYNMLTPGF